jgi:hypothetical protein
MTFLDLAGGYGIIVTELAVRGRGSSQPGVISQVLNRIAEFIFGPSIPRPIDYLVNNPLIDLLIPFLVLLLIYTLAHDYLSNKTEEQERAKD